jgi:uncharacterized protein (DUF1778 family)
MPGRSQINFRIDAELLANIKQSCELKGITLTDFITNACKIALEIEPAKLSTETVEVINLQVEKYLASKLASIEERLATMENQLLQISSTTEMEERRLHPGNSLAEVIQLRNAIPR